jgi:hypothetical protein
VEAHRIPITSIHPSCQSASIQFQSLRLGKKPQILVKGQTSAELSQVVEGKGNIKSANVSQLGYAI